MKKETNEEGFNSELGNKILQKLFISNYDFSEDEIGFFKDENNSNFILEKYYINFFPQDNLPSLKKICFFEELLDEEGSDKEKNKVIIENIEKFISNQLLALSQSCDENEVDENGNTELMLACSKGSFEEAQKILLEQKIDVSVENNDGKKALDFAFQKVSENNNHQDKIKWMWIVTEISNKELQLYKKRKTESTKKETDDEKDRPNTYNICNSNTSQLAAIPPRRK